VLGGFYGEGMSFTTYATLEQMMQQRVADRLHEAAQDRLAQVAHSTSSSPRRRATVVGLLSYVISLL
jgi:hypothetical protein